MKCVVISGGKGSTLRAAFLDILAEREPSRVGDQDYLRELMLKAMELKVQDPTITTTRAAILAYAQHRGEA